MTGLSVRCAPPSPRPRSLSALRGPRSPCIEPRRARRVRPPACLGHCSPCRAPHCRLSGASIVEARAARVDICRSLGAPREALGRPSEAEGGRRGQVSVMSRARGGGCASIEPESAASGAARAARGGAARALGATRVTRGAARAAIGVPREALATAGSALGVRGVTVLATRAPPASASSAWRHDASYRVRRSGTGSAASSSGITHIPGLRSRAEADGRPTARPTSSRPRATYRPTRWRLPSLCSPRRASRPGRSSPRPPNRVRG